MAYDYTESFDTPAVSAKKVEDADYIGQYCKALYVGTGGDVEVTLVEDNSSVVFKSVPSGTTLNIRPKRVNLSATTATDLVALF